MGNPRFTNLDLYYQDSQQFGDYQYNSIENIVNNFMHSIDNDNFVHGIARSRVVYHAKRGVQEFRFDVLNEIIAIELELNPSLTIPLPHDYINYVRISWVDECGKLHPLAVDNSLNLSQAYLQDNDYNFLFDNQGDILQGTHIQNRQECSRQPFGYNSLVDYTLDGPNSYVFPYYWQSGPFNTNRSKIFKNGSYKIDREAGVIQFSSNVDGRIIVLEYISDGLFQRADNQAKMHKFAEEAIYSYIYYKLVERRRNIPANEKERARREFYNNRRIAKRRIKPIRHEELRQVLNGSGRYIKD